MSAVVMRLHAELRARWRGLVAIALLVGLAGAAVLASFAGARRTASAYPRFIDAYDQFEVLVDPEPRELEANMRAFDAVRGLDSVADSSIVNLVEFGLVTIDGRDFGFPDIFVLWSDNDRFLRTFHRLKLVDGRRADPLDPTEAEMPFTVADRFDIEPGDEVTVHFGPTERSPEGASRVVEVVGIGATPGSFEPSGGSYFPFVAISRALVDDVGAGAPSDPVMMVDVVGDEAGADAVERSSRFQVVALQVLGVLAALAALAVVGQAIVRATVVGGDDAEALAALGMARGQVFALGMARALVIGVAGAAMAIGGAILLSPALPFGPMRIAEPDPGFAVDWFVLGVGAPAVIGAVLVVAAWPAWRVGSAVRRARMRETEGARGVRLTRALARAGAPPTVVAGMRAAIERGRGATAVPIRTTLAGTSVSIAALVAAIVFAASLAHLVETPRLAGWDFDAVLATDPPLPPVADELTALDVVEAVGLGGGANVSIGGVELLSFTFFSGDVEASISAGRAPQARDEIAVGPRTMRRMGVGIGDTIDVEFAHQETGESGGVREMRIVGRSVTPTFFFSLTPPGEGAVIPVAAARAYVPGYGPDTIYIRFRDGVAVDDGVHAVNTALDRPFLIPRRTSSDLANLERVAGLPYVLAALLGLMGAGALIHTLVSSVRRRRLELGVLKSIGFVRAQVAATVGWQTSVIVVAALALGVPAGIAGGRWAWLTFADQIGFVPVAVIPPLAIGLTVPVALLLANLIAAIPARSAAGTQPAVILRAE